MAVKAIAAFRPPERPSIEIRAGELPRLVCDAELALIRDGGIYQRGGQLVRIACLDADLKKDGVRRSAGSYLILPVNLDYLRLALSRAAEWTKWDGRNRSVIATDAPVPVAKALMSASGEWKLPVLTGLISAPTLRRDGSLLDVPGYDQASGLYGAFDVADFPRISPMPSRDDAIAALGLLRDLFGECQFAGGANSAHASVAIAATITAAVRHALPTAPGFGFSAHKAGSGKTTTASAIGQICTGKRPPVLALSEDEAELRKALLAILIAGDAVILLDNIARPVDSAALCALLTNPTYSDRILGINQRAVVPTASTWLLTGNHLEFVGDLTSRVLLSVLDPEVEHPESREFKRDLAAYVADHRGDLLAAALTIPLAYLNADSPAISAPRSRFPEWDRLVRRPLLWLGEADPLETQALVEAADPEREMLLAVLGTWRSAFDDRPATVAMAIEDANAGRGSLLEALHGVAGDRNGSINARRLGRWLVRHLRRIESGMRFEDGLDDPITTRRRYRVTCVSSVAANPSREIRNLNEGSAGDAENEGNAVCQSCRGEGCRWCE
jgi:putative DNA primase/helicase